MLSDQLVNKHVSWNIFIFIVLRNRCSYKCTYITTSFELYIVWIVYSCILCNIIKIFPLNIPFLCCLITNTFLIFRKNVALLTICKSFIILVRCILEASGILLQCQLYYLYSVLSITDVIKLISVLHDLMDCLFLGCHIITHIINPDVPFFLYVTNNVMFLFHHLGQNWIKTFTNHTFIHVGFSSLLNQCIIFISDKRAK